MSYFEFNPFGTSAIVVSFECDECGTHVESEEISVPSPDYSADTAHDSQMEEERYAVCEKCEKQFEISIYVTYAGGDGRVEDLDDEAHIEVKEISDSYDKDWYDAISYNSDFYDTFSAELKNLKALSEANIFTSPLIDTLYRQIYIGVISTMETYLSDAFINTTLKSKEFTENFVTTFADFKDKKIGYATLFDEYNKLDDTCKKAMLEVIYHNLGKVKGMYKATIDVDLGDIANMSKHVVIRHDLVHRNGKTKEGAQHTINQKVIEELTSDVEQFIQNIDNQIKKSLSGNGNIYNRPFD